MSTLLPSQGNLCAPACRAMTVAIKTRRSLDLVAEQQIDVPPLVCFRDTISHNNCYILLSVIFYLGSVKVQCDLRPVWQSRGL